MSTVREEWIRYGAKDGVVETYFHSNGRDLRSLLNFLNRAFEISDNNIKAQKTKVYRVLDSFFTMFYPNFVPHIARKLVDRAKKETPVQVLLADPTGEFASVRSKSIGALRGDSATEISKGLKYILSELTRTHPKLFSRTLKKAQLTSADILAAINRHRLKTYVEVRLYDKTPSGPMFFFPPVLVYGRFCAGRNSNELPWSIIVNDAVCAGDLYSIYQEEFEFLWNGVRRAVDGKRRAETVGTNVFIGHGRSLIWRELKDFIADRLRFPVDEFNRVPGAGITNIARLSEMLDAAAIAFLIMTGEDEQPDGKLRARMNVVHEAGLFQGRLGFTRAIVILEDGCETFSNIEGLGQIRFPKGDIKAAFEEIRQVIEREGLLSADGLLQSA